MSFQLDTIVADAVDQAREAAEEEARDFGVGRHLETVAEGNRLVTHYFECLHPGYPGWRWAVTMARASRARRATINEVTLLPSEASLEAPKWVPWAQRIEPGDIRPGTLLPTLDNDPRLEPGYGVVTDAAEGDPADLEQENEVATQLGLGRERVLSLFGKQETIQRWLESDAGSQDASSKLAPAQCESCGYWVRLSGALGTIFGVCTNKYANFDAQAVSHEHGCGGHSDVIVEQRPNQICEPVFDTVTLDDSLFD